MKATLNFQTTIGEKNANVGIDINGDESNINVNINETYTSVENNEVQGNISIMATRRQKTNSFNGSFSGTYTIDDQIALIRAADTWLNENSERIINLVNNNL